MFRQPVLSNKVELDLQRPHPHRLTFFDAACKAQIAHNTFAQQNHQVLVHMQRICQNLEKVKFVIKRELQKCPQDGIVSKQQMATFNSEPPDSLNEALSLILLSLYSVSCDDIEVTVFQVGPLLRNYKSSADYRTVDSNEVRRTRKSCAGATRRRL